MKLKNLLSAFVILLLSFSCNNEEIKTDNIYKFKEYISYTTSGEVSTSQNININLAQEVEGWETDKEISSEIIKIKPAVKGVLKSINKHAVVFIPKDKLQPDTEYMITVKLNNIYKNIPKGYDNYTFQFKTITPNFKIETDVLQSHSKDYQYLEGVVKSADIINLIDAKKLIKATQKAKVKHIIWNESNKESKIFEFKIDSIKRFIDDSDLKISWNGMAINSDNKGENEITIPGKNNFKVLSINASNTAEKFISINFSDPLKKQQNFDGLISLKGIKSPRFIVNRNQLKVFSNEIFKGSVLVSVFEGIKNSSNYKLKSPFSESVTFDR